MQYRKIRFWIYPLCLLVGGLSWYFTVSKYSIYQLYSDFWESGLTMMFGSFVAGSTPLGGGAVAFPVLTKLFLIEPQQAKLFSLFIQSVGMSFATILFFSLNIKIVWRWIFLLLPGSCLGLWLGLFCFSSVGSSIKLLFSLFVLITGVFLTKVHLDKCQLAKEKKRGCFNWLIVLSGIPAGFITSLIGSGADTLLFFILVVVLKKRSQSVIPTTVTYMAICSLVGTVMTLFLQDTFISEFIINSWLVAAPVVAIGAPLGGYVMSRFNSNHLFGLIIVVIWLEGLSTLIFVPLSLLERLSLTGLIVFGISYLIYKLKILKSLTLSIQSRKIA